jgi:hypothetical protein
MKIQIEGHKMISNIKIDQLPGWSLCGFSVFNNRKLIDLQFVRFEIDKTRSEKFPKKMVINCLEVIEFDLSMLDIFVMPKITKIESFESNSKINLEIILEINSHLRVICDSLNILSWDYVSDSDSINERS